MQGKRPTRAQTEFLREQGLCRQDWLVQKYTPQIIRIKNRETGEQKIYEFIDGEFHLTNIKLARKSQQEDFAL